MLTKECVPVVSTGQKRTTCKESQPFLGHRGVCIQCDISHLDQRDARAAALAASLLGSGFSGKKTQFINQ